MELGGDGGLALVDVVWIYDDLEEGSFEGEYWLFVWRFNGQEFLTPVEIALGESTTLAPRGDLEAGVSVLGDINGDGLTDIGISDGVWLGAPAPATFVFGETVASSESDSPFVWGVGDLNQDGLDDIAVGRWTDFLPFGLYASYPRGPLEILLASGSELVRTTPAYTIMGERYERTGRWGLSEDLDGDGERELLIVSGYPDIGSVSGRLDYYADSFAAFSDRTDTAKLNSSLKSSTYRYVLRPLDLQARPALVAMLDIYSLRVVVTDAERVVTKPMFDPPEDHSLDDIEVVDLDQDGRLDIVGLVRSNSGFSGDPCTQIVVWYANPPESEPPHIGCGPPPTVAVSASASTSDSATTTSEDTSTTVDAPAASMGCLGCRQTTPTSGLGAATVLFVWLAAMHRNGGGYHRGRVRSSIGSRV